MGIFADLFKKSNFFTSEYTDKSMMSLLEVMNAHANWKTRLNQFLMGTLPYNLDPEMLAQADDTELGRWILQSDTLEMSDERRKLIQQLHQANDALHKAASSCASHKLNNNPAAVGDGLEQISSASKQIMILLRDLNKDT